MDEVSQGDVQSAIASERAKWEKILENAQKVSEDYSTQVQTLTSQLQELRQRLQEQAVQGDVQLSDKVKELEEALTKARLECLEREKAATRRAREESELTLKKEREATEAAFQALGAEEEDRIKRRVKESKKEWEKQRELLESEIVKLKERLAAFEKRLSDGDDKTSLVKQERNRARRLEKQVESLTAEIAQLKDKLIQKQQQLYQGPLEGLSKDVPDMAKLQKTIDSYAKEIRILRSQVDAHRPEKLVELQGMLRMQGDEHEKLKDELRTLKNLLLRQERELNANKDMGEDHASRIQSIVTDLQMSKEECRRLREKLDLANKSLKSRVAMEEAMRTKLEKTERRCKAAESKLRDLRDLRSKSAEPPDDEAQPSDDKETVVSLRAELDALRCKCTDVEAERDATKRMLKGKLREKTQKLKMLQEVIDAPAATSPRRAARAVQPAPSISPRRAETEANAVAGCKEPDYDELRAELEDRNYQITALKEELAETKSQLSAARERIAQLEREAATGVKALEQRTRSSPGDKASLGKPTAPTAGPSGLRKPTQISGLRAPTSLADLASFEHKDSLHKEYRPPAAAAGGLQSVHRRALDASARPYGGQRGGNTSASGTTAQPAPGPISAGKRAGPGINVGAEKAAAAQPSQREQKASISRTEDSAAAPPAADVEPKVAALDDCSIAEEMLETSFTSADGDVVGPTTQAAAESRKSIEELM